MATIAGTSSTLTPMCLAPDADRILPQDTSHWIMGAQWPPGWPEANDTSRAQGFQATFWRPRPSRTKAESHGSRVRSSRTFGSCEQEESRALGRKSRKMGGSWDAATRLGMMKSSLNSLTRRVGSRRTSCHADDTSHLGIEVTEKQREISKEKRVTVCELRS
jgi:hypothetical protein